MTDDGTRDVSHVHARTGRRVRAMHYARVDAAVALQREGLLAEDSPDGLRDALEGLGTMPPASYVDQLRHRYPRIYAEAERTRDRQDEADTLRRLNAHALVPYAEDLLELADRIADLEAGDYERHVDTDGLRVPLALAGEDLLEATRDEYDALIGASFAASHGPG